MERETWLIIIAAISLSTFGLSYLFGYFQLQWYFALGIFGAVFGGFFFAHRKATKVWDEPERIIEKNRESLTKLGIMTEVGFKNVRGTRVDEHLDASDRGRYWYIIVGDGPNYHPLLFSAKSGKLVHWDMKGSMDESPVKSLRDKPIPPQVVGQTHEIKYEEKVRPEKKPAPLAQ